MSWTLLNLKWSALLLAVLLYTSGQTQSRPFVEKVTIMVRDGQGNPIRSAIVQLTPYLHGTRIVHTAKEENNNCYIFTLKPSDFYENQFNLVVSAPGYRTAKSLFNSGMGKSITITLVNDDYQKKYHTDSNTNMESFGQINLELDNDQAGTRKINFSLTLPLPKEFISFEEAAKSGITYVPLNPVAKRSDLSPALRHAISSRDLRQRIYVDLLKELILQSAAEKIHLYGPNIEKWLENEYSQFAELDNRDISRISASVAEYLGPAAEQIFPQVADKIKTAGIVISLNSAYNSGFLQGLLTYVSYRAMQEECLSILEQTEPKLPLQGDAAFANALRIVRFQITNEENMRLEEILEKYGNSSLTDKAAETVFKGLLTAGFGATLKTAGMTSGVGAVAVVCSELAWDLLNSRASSQKLESSLLLLQVLDRDLFSTVPARFDANQQTLTSLPSGFLQLMRIHAGYLFHKIRSQYLEGTGSGMTGRLLAIMRSSPYRERMILNSANMLERLSKEYLDLTLALSQLQLANREADRQRVNQMIDYLASKKVSQLDDDPSALRLTRVEGGSFRMGNFDSDPMARWDQLPVHSVRINTFYLSCAEITVAQYRAFCRSKNLEMPAQPAGSTDNHPVVNVTWKEALAYCESFHGRLPTEAEWEYAARSRGGEVRFGNGEQIARADEINFNAQDKEQYTHSQSGVNRGTLTQVKSFAPNQTGLYDMSGNAAEWCMDWYGDDYYASSPGDNPQGPAAGRRKVVRGGSYSDRAVNVRADSRISMDPTFRNPQVGFRVYRSDE